MFKVKAIFNYEGTISKEDYEEIVLLSKKELGVFIRRDTGFFEKKALLRRAREIISSIQNYNPPDDYTGLKFIDSLPNLNFRKKPTLEKKIEQQIFVNNFVISNNELFLETLKRNNFSIQKIALLDSKIKSRKIEIKGTTEDTMSEEGFGEIRNICKDYNLNLPELFINKILELYYLNYELLSTLDDEKSKIKKINNIKKR